MKHTSFSLLPAVLALVFTAFPGTAPAAPLNAPEYVATTIVPETTSVRPGDTLTLMVEQTIKPGWHTYWKNPGDSGEALTVTWTLPEGLSAGALQWPSPHRMPIGPLLNFGYSEKVRYLTDIAVPENYTGTSITLNADLAWLVCEEICIPETTKIDLSVPVTQDTPVATDEAAFKQARAAMPRSVAWPGMLEELDGSLMLSFTPDSEEVASLQGATDFAFFPEEWGLIQYAAPQTGGLEGNQIKLQLKRDTRALKDVPEIKGIITYVKADGTHEGVAAPAPAPDQPAASYKIASDITLPQALVFALLGGLILNLMPCVFPVLSIKALGLIRMSTHEQAHAVTHGIMYTLGILLSFGALAGVLISLQQAGAQIGWGFQLQSPVVVLLLSYLLFILGLNLAGFFEISGGGLTNVGSGLARKHGYSGSFFTGMLATIVATPCTAPAMGAAMGYALTQGPVTVIAISLALGFGLALPYLLLTCIPPLRKALPKPGHWMETFRQFLSFPMFGFAAWLLWVYSQQVDDILYALLGLVMIAFGIWMWRNAPVRREGRALVRLISILSFLIALAVAAVSMTRTSVPLVEGQLTPEQSPMQHAGNWKNFTQADFDTALKGNDPVFVNMTAAWCITCKVNEKVALAPQSTQDLFTAQKVTYFIGDWTNQNPEITKFLSVYGRNGVPLYVYVGSRDLTTNQRPEPVVLPQLLTPGLIEDIVTYN
jgi:thiol:disulfide interchange protein DsbD